MSRSGAVRRTGRPRGSSGDRGAVKVALHFNSKLKECQMKPSPNDTLHSHITQELKTTTVLTTHYKASEVSLCLPYVHLGNVS